MALKQMQPETKVREQLDFEHETDYGLIEYMSLEDSIAEVAWGEFYRRHVGFVFNRIKGTYSGAFQDGSINDLTAETFIRAFSAAKTFKQFPNLEPNEQRPHVRAWLGKIAVNIIVGEFRRSQGIELVYADECDEDGNDGWDRIWYEQWKSSSVVPKRVSPELEERKKLIRDAWALLDEREQHVLRVTFDYDRPERVSQRLPNRISKELADSLGTTPENVRKIRSRAKRKIRHYIDQRSESQK